MPLHTTASYLLFEARKRMKAAVAPCQLCNFSYEVSDYFLNWLKLQTSGHPFLKVEKIDRLLACTREERIPLLGELWEMFGFEKPFILESNAENGATIADFNLDLRKDPGIQRQFDLVDNSGVTEHVFDQKAVFENIHELCRVGGLMTHRIPMYGVLNITLYGITPRTLVDLATANRYQVECLWISNRWGDVVPVRLEGQAPPEVFTNDLPAVAGSCRGLGHPGPRERETLKKRKVPKEWELPESLDLKTFLSKAPLMDKNNGLSRACHALILRGEHFRPGNAGEIYVMGIFRKIHDEPFRVPYQGNNLKAIGNDTMRERYRNQIEAAGL